MVTSISLSFDVMVTLEQSGDGLLFLTRVNALSSQEMIFSVGQDNTYISMSACIVLILLFNHVVNSENAH
jgi:hypothetical protein